MNDLLGNMGNYVYFGLQQQINKFLHGVIFDNCLSEVELLFNIDGFPVSKIKNNIFNDSLC